MVSASHSMLIINSRFVTDGYDDLASRMAQLVDSLPIDRYPLRSADAAVVVAALLREFPHLKDYILSIVKDV